MKVKLCATLFALAAVVLLAAPAYAAPPDAPSPCYVNGQESPGTVSMYYPRFFATYLDSDDCATDMQVQIGTDSDWAVAEVWDSGYVSISQIANGENSSSLVYPNADLAVNTSYYWRVRFRDQAAGDGFWSTTQEFSTAASLQTILAWDKCDRASGYYVHFGTATNPAYCASVTGTTWDPGTLDYDTTYYWKVIAYNATGNSSTTEWSFKTLVELPTQVTGASPYDTENGVAIDVTLDWDNSDRATGYYVHFGTSPSPAYCASTTLSEWDPPGNLDYFTTYYWKVIAYNAAGNATAAEWSFRTIIEAPTQVTGASPTDEEQDVPIDVTLDWDNATRADGYYVHFGTNASPDYCASVTLSEWDPPSNLDYDTSYYWKVIAYNNGGNATAAEWSFRTIAQPGLDNLTGTYGTQGVPLADFDNEAWGTTSTVHFTWDCGSGVTGFYWYFGPSANPADTDYKDYTTNLYTDFHTAAVGSNYFYVKASDGFTNSTAVIYVYNYDGAVPVVTGAHIQSGSAHASDDGYDNQGGITAGTTDVYGDYNTLTEVNPDCASFTLTVTGGTGSDTLWNNSDTDSPSPMQFTGLTLTGGTKLLLEIVNYDKAGQNGSSTSIEYFVKPYTPQAPTVAQVSGNWTALDVNVVAHASENEAIEYAIYCDTTGQWVQSDGSLGASPYYQTEGSWGTVRVTGLSGDTSYGFQTRSRNYYDSDVLSDNSPSGNETTVIEPPEAPSNPSPPDGATGVPAG